MSRATLAHFAQIDESALARVEWYRAPLRYATAIELLCYFDLNPIWLFNGQGPQSPYIRVPLPETLGVRNTASFSDVFRDFLASHIMQGAESERASPGIPKHKPGFDPESARRRARMITDIFLDLEKAVVSIPEDKEREFKKAVLTLIWAKVSDCPKPDWKTVLERSAGLALLKERRATGSFVTLTRDEDRILYGAGKLLVDTKPSSDSFHAMKALPKTWIQLRDLVLKRTEESGAKAQLARDVGVSRQAVNKWLNQGVEPSAETTLRLLAWVTAREAKQ